MSNTLNKCPYAESMTNGDYCYLYHQMCDCSCTIAKSDEKEATETVKVGGKE